MNSIKKLGAIGSADIIGSGISGFFWFYIATLLEVEQYGQIHYIIGIVSIAYIFSIISTSGVITVYVSKNLKLESTLYLISLIGAAIASIVIIAFFNRYDAAALLLGFIINDLVMSYILGKKCYTTYTKYVLTQKILTLVLGIGFFFVFGVNGIIFGLALSYIHFAIIIFKVFRSIEINFTLLNSRAGFIINNYALNLTGGLRSHIDKLLIPPIMGFALLGNYALALQIFAILMIFPNIVFKFILPEDSSGNSNTKLKKITVLASIGISLFGIIIIPMIVPILFPKYIQAVQAIQIMSIAIIPATIGQQYMSKFLSLEKSKFVAIGSLISLTTIISGIVTLGPIFGIIGVATAFVTSAAFRTIFFVLIFRIIK